MSPMRRWRGLKALVQDAVVHASHAIERVHKHTARRPFDVLAQIPPVAAPAQVVRVIHDATVTGVHGAIRMVTRAVGATLDVALDAVASPAPAPDNAAPAAHGDSGSSDGRPGPDASEPPADGDP